MNERIQVFDPRQDYHVIHRRLAHWSQAGTVTFVTWRTWDSIPSHVLQTWRADRNEWLRRHGVDVSAPNWRALLQALGPALVREFQRTISERWNDHLDACHGACELRKPELSQIVADCLRHFDGDRYELTDFAIMPNHVHLLVTFPDESSMLEQCDSWKHFTAKQINRVLGRRGRFWQQDGFDHLVRSAEQYDYLRRYFADNPSRAKLRIGEYRLYSTHAM